MKRYFDEPYEFIRPYRGNFWCRAITPLMPRVLRQLYQVDRWKFLGTEHLRQSINDGAGIMLTPNHTGFADPPVMGMLGIEIGQFFYYLASWHLFKQSRFARFKLTRTGAFSIFREGVDREALRESVRIIGCAERPLVVFPEGTWFRRNDRVGPLQEGMSLIARRACKESDRPIVLHPVAIKYWCLGDPRPAMRQHLAKVEARLRWHPQEHLDIHQRITKLTMAFVAVKEMELLGEARTGDLDRRIASLYEHVLTDLEHKHKIARNTGRPMDRIRVLLQLLMRNFQSTGQDLTVRTDCERDIERVFFCQALYGHSQEYVEQWPCLERMSESIKRLEEDLTAAELNLGPMGAVIEIGPGISIRDMPKDRNTSVDLVSLVGESMQSMIDELLRQGPPAEWDCLTQARPDIASPVPSPSAEPFVPVG